MTIAEPVSDLCADFLSERRYEPAVRKLTSSLKAGQWERLSSLLENVGLGMEELSPSVWAAWLKYPTDSDYAVVVFFDDRSHWSTTAVYNVARLSRLVAESGAVTAAVA